MMPAGLLSVHAVLLNFGFSADAYPYVFTACAMAGAAF
jgi:hypothetical protein